MTIRQRHLNRSDDLDGGAGALAEEVPAATQTVGAHRAADRGEPPELGGYEEHYQVTGSAALGLASILALILGIVLQTWAILFPIAIVLALLATVVRPAAVPNGFAIAFAAVRRMIAFRADQAGITLGAVPGTARSGRAAVLVPWADIQQIILYPVDPVGRGRYAQVRCIGIQRRPGAPALAQGNEQAPGSPVPDVASGATRRIIGWRLDRERLAAVAASAAPGIPVIAFSAGPSPVIEGP
jgi:hypothetical protein